MSASAPQPHQPPDNDPATPFVRVERDARALIGWMAPDSARVVLMGQRVDGATPMEVLAQARQARDTVAARAPGVDQAEVLVDPPRELDSYISQLRAAPGLAAFVNEGWEVKVADLRRIVSFQPQVFTDDAEERTSALDETDIVAIARVSLPLPSPTQLPAQFDQSRQAWILSSANPNLRVTGQLGGEVQPGVVGFGFAVAVLPSVMQVAAFRGRMLLRDGYHRAYGLLRRGITHAPVYFRQFSTIEELAIHPSMLPQDAFLGERPPTLADYLDDGVAATVRLPAAQKMIVVQALELAPLG